MTRPYRLALSEILAAALALAAVSAPCNGTAGQITADASGGTSGVPLKLTQSRAASVTEPPGVTVTDDDGKTAKAKVQGGVATANRGGGAGGPKARLPLVQKANMAYQGAFRV